MAEVMSDTLQAVESALGSVVESVIKPPGTEYPGVALITGAATGIGAATAWAFAREGCPRLALTDTDSDGLATRTLEIQKAFPGVRLLSHVGDVAEDDFADAFVKMSVAKFGRIDYCVNSASVRPAPAARQRSSYTPNSPSLTPESSSSGTLSTISTAPHLRSLQLSSRAELCAMRTQSTMADYYSTPNPVSSSFPSQPGLRGAIVNVSAIAVPGTSGDGGSSSAGENETEAPAHSTMRDVVAALTREDAAAFGADGVRVNCICPGVVAEEEAVNPSVGTGAEVEEGRERVGEVKEAVRGGGSGGPLGRVGRASEVAEACVWLCGPRSSFVQGSCLVVDGGFAMG